MLLVPSTSPDFLLEIVARLPEPKALLRAGRPDSPFLLSFPLILDPEEIPRPGKKDDVVLVSADYAWIRWAKGKGFRGVWANFPRKRCPELHPLHDLEVRTPNDLERPWKFRLPDLEESLGILRDHGVPENVVEHSAVVAAVAFALAERLREKDVPVDPLLVHRGGLLHDLDKIWSIKEGNDHGERAAEILTKLGYPELGEIAKRHVLHPERLPRTWEEKLVFLADKLVEGKEVVGIRRRLSALLRRYPGFREEIRAGKPFISSLQNEVLSALGISEPELLEELKMCERVLPETLVGGGQK
jgi:putative nucleotidyltransferase with HDIG domain